MKQCFVGSAKFVLAQKKKTQYGPYHPIIQSAGHVVAVQCMQQFCAQKKDLLMREVRGDWSADGLIGYGNSDNRSLQATVS